MLASILEPTALRHCILVLAFIPFLTSAGLAEDHWTSIGPEGGTVLTLAIDPKAPTVLYAGTDGSGVFKTSEGGASWDTSNNGLRDLTILSLAINPTDTNTVYVGTYWNGVFKTTDGGGNWSSANNGLTGNRIRALAIDPTNTNTVYAGTYWDGLFKTTDGGLNWSAANNGLTGSGIHALAIDPSDSMTLYAGTGSSGVFKSTDGGASWRAANSGIPTAWVNCFAIDPADRRTLYAGTSNQVFKTTDGGENWGVANNDPNYSIGSVLALVIDPTDSMTVYAGILTGFVKTTDGGESWSAVNDDLADIPVNALVIDPADPATLYAGTDSAGVFITSDEGTNWIETNTGLSSTWVNALAVDPSDPLTLYAGGTVATGVFKTTDGGVNWRNVGLTLVPVWVLTIDPVDPLTLYAGTAGGVWKTTDGGESWGAASSGLTSYGVEDLAIDPANRLTLYACTSDGVFKTTDGGENWRTANNGLTAESVQAVVIDPTDALTLYAGSTSGVFKSIDGGENWSPSRDGMSSIWVSSLSIDPAEPLRLYAGTGWGGVFKTTDGGENWSAVNNGLTERDIRTLAINPNETMTLYAGTWEGVFKTTDGGENWTPFNAGLDILSVGVLAIDRQIPSTVYAGTDGSGVFTFHGDGLSSIFFPQFADGVTGGLRFQSTLILTNTGSTSPVRVELYSTPDGSPMETRLGELGTGSSFEFELREGHSISLPTPGIGDLQVGYARIVAGQRVGGVVVFKSSDPASGTALYEAGVPASEKVPELSLFVDSLGVRDTGLAIVYPPLDEGASGADAKDATATIRLHDKLYNLVAEKTLDPLAPGSHMARFVHELFDDPQVKAQAREMEGTLVVKSDQPLVAVTVRQNDDPAKEFPEEVPFLTTFPVIPGAPGEDNEPESILFSFFFPQFADGQMASLQLQSTLILVNSGADAVVRVELYRTPDGEPMALTLGDLGTGSVFEFELKEGESISLPTPGTGDLKVGYARVIAAPDVGGVVVFRRTDLTTGVPLFEAGVPASEQLKEFCLFVDSLGVRDTGVAIVYRPEEEGSSPAQHLDAHVTLRLYDKHYNSIAEESLDPMAPGTHMARFVRELFTDPAVKAQAREMEGILVVESDQPLVAVTVRQNDHPLKEFPQEVPILTTFPVMPGAPD